MFGLNSKVFEKIYEALRKIPRIQPRHKEGVRVFKGSAEKEALGRSYGGFSTKNAYDG